MHSARIAVATTAALAAVALAITLFTPPRAEAVLWRNPAAGNCWVHTWSSGAPSFGHWVWVDGIADNLIRWHAAGQAGNWDAMTNTTMHFTSNVNVATLRMQDGNWGQTGWVGLTQPTAACASGWMTLSYNHFYLYGWWGGDQPAIANAACHEIGHALGLEHDNQGGCMTPPGGPGRPFVPTANNATEVSLAYALFGP
jgi:hypothetical protein